MWEPLNEKTEESRGRPQQQGEGLNNLPNASRIPSGPYLADEVPEAEDGPVVEHRVIEDIGQHPGKGEAEAGGQPLPAELEAEAGVVQAADGQRELQQVVLVFRLVPPSLQSRQERTACECQGGTSPRLLGRIALQRKCSWAIKGSGDPPNDRGAPW